VELALKSGFEQSNYAELDDTRLLPRALRADSVVRSGILPQQSGLRRDVGLVVDAVD
jgi:hypothetical protein